jgi:hypothetical protein
MFKFAHMVKDDDDVKDEGGTEVKAGRGGD